MLDRIPWLRKWRIRVTAAVIFCMFLMCCSCTLQGGMYILQLMDWYTSSMALLCVCLCEVFIFSYSYGVGRTIRDIQMMTQKHVNYYWYFCLLFVTPILLIMVFINQIVNFAPASCRGVVFPVCAQAIGWTLAVLPTTMIPIFLVVYLCSSSGTFKERITGGFTPTSSWGPLSAERRAQWNEYCNSRLLRHKLLHPDWKPLKSTSYQLVSQTQKF
ncbi:sodium-dependent noradrenaline transporter-like [Palaemon carinicauda]|uniref:sodium-dependent noradrenaline transporter-like n=1 Tax=Palaemon carinicauda TaxID=392227 RepID=UPI0035B5D4C9